MTKYKRSNILLVVILLCVVIAAFFIIKQRHNSNAAVSQTKQVPQPTLPPANSPEGVTQTYYNLYAACLKQHPHDLNNANNLKKDCPIHKYAGISNNLTQTNVLKYTDQVLCDEGIPEKMIIGKAYIGTDKVANVDVTNIFPLQKLVIPVRLHKESGNWKIFEIDCDLDGHID